MLKETSMTKTDNMTLASVLKTISDPELRTKTRLSRRQYYSRISNFTKNGMLTKKNRRIYRTTFGRVIYHTLMTVENISNYYKLKAIDSMHAIPQEEHKKIIDTLITDPDIRDILSSS
jgi:hypothetical protein